MKLSLYNWNVQYLSVYVCVCVVCSEELTATKTAFGAKIRQLQSELKAKENGGVMNTKYYQQSIIITMKHCTGIHAVQLPYTELTQCLQFPLIVTPIGFWFLVGSLPFRL